MDFALWKSAKPGEPSWDSPWGPGRPGWHIECSAMSSSLLGDSFDIHGGGRDLIFPHHENEIAQSEGASGKPFVKYWIHNGFVNVNQEKMSKSLGNFFTIRDILKVYDAEVVRFFILTAHYRSPIDFSDHNLKEARTGLSRFYEALQSAEQTSAIPADPAAPSSTLGAELKLQFVEAMNDDFNTALAIAHLFEGVRTINRLVATKKFAKKPDLVAQVKDLHTTITELGSVLGILGSQPAEWLERVRMAGLAGLDISKEEIETLINERLVARQNRNFERGDQIRSELEERGIELLDSREGTSWKLKD
jgi:cysteinyl-tRNA synthetase